MLEIGEVITDFADSGGTRQDHAFLRILSRIAHIFNRVRRFPKLLDTVGKVPDGERGNVIAFHKEYYATCFKLEADLYDQINNVTVEAVPAPQPVINIPPPVLHCSKSNT